MKKCSICKTEKCFSKFWRRKDRKSGYSSACKDCSNEKRYKKKIQNWEHHINVRKIWYEKNRKKQIEKQTNYNKNKADRKKIYARHQLNDAVKLGHIKRMENCQICNRKCKTEAHHADYTKPLDVIWVCKKCHIKIHK
jgi:hypothetical protein